MSITAKTTRLNSARGAALWIISIGAIFLFLPGPALGQASETYIYPGTTSATEFTIGNVNSDTAVVTASFFNASGDADVRTLTLAPGKQTRFTAESLDIEDFGGSTVISSALPVAVTATIFEDEGSFEHLTPVTPGIEVVIPFAPAFATIDLKIFNPGALDAQVTVVLIGADGTQIGTRPRSVGSNQTINESVFSEAVASIVVRSSNFFLGGRELASSALIRNFTPDSAGGVPRTDLAYVPGLVVQNQGPTADVPLFVQGDGYFSILQVVNNSNGAQTVNVSARDLDGAIVPASNNPASIELPARASNSETIEDLFGLLTTGLVIGSVSVEGTASLSAVVAVGQVSQPSLALVPTGTEARSDFVYQTRRVGSGFFLGLNLFNPGAIDANLELTFVLDDGETVSGTRAVVPGATRITPSLAQLFPEAQGNGFVLVRSDLPIEAGGVEGRSDGTALSLLRALPASSEFEPAPRTSNLAVGVVRSGGAGVRGITVELLGPTSRTTLTDLNGTFLFRDLLPGSYSVRAEALGFDIEPSQRSFIIDGENSRENDFTAVLLQPSITSVTPDGLAVGSASGDIVVEGGPFIGDSVVLIETTELPTTFVSSEILVARVDATLLSTPLEVNLVVRNPSPSGDSVESAPVIFVIGDTPPRLDELSGQPVPVVAGASGFALTVRGSGFIPGARLLIDGSPRATTFVSDTELRAQILAQDLAEGGLLAIQVRNPGPAVRSNALELAVLHPVPVITAISPGFEIVRVEVDAPPMELVVDGLGFEEDAVITVDSTPVPTEFSSSRRLVGAVPPDLLATSGVRQVVVHNPEPSLAVSYAYPLFLTNPMPVLSSIEGSITFDPARSNVRSCAVEVH